MPTPTGHATDKPNRFTVGERELAKRKILSDQIAHLSQPLIDADLLTLASAPAEVPKRSTGKGVRDLGICPYPGCKTLCVGRYCRTHRGDSYSLADLLTPEQRPATALDIRRALNLRNTLVRKKTKSVATGPRWYRPRLPRGISAQFRAGEPRKPVDVTPDWLPQLMSRGSAMRNVRDTLGRGFGYWRLLGGDVRFAGKLAAHMERDELLAALAWFSHGCSAWKHATLVFCDKKYKASFTPAGAVTERMKDKDPLPTLWLASGTPPIIDPRKVG